MQDFISIVTRWDPKQKGSQQLPQKPILFSVRYVFTTLHLQLPNSTQRRVPLSWLHYWSLLPAIVHCCKLASCAVQSKGLGQGNILHPCPPLPLEPVLKIWRFNRSKHKNMTHNPLIRNSEGVRLQKYRKRDWEAELSGLYTAEIQKVPFCGSLEWKRIKSITGCN